MLVLPAKPLDGIRCIKYVGVKTQEMGDSYICVPQIRIHNGRLQSIILNTPISDVSGIQGKNIYLELKGEFIQGFVFGEVLFHTYNSLTLKVFTIEFRQNNALVLYADTQMGYLQIDGVALSEPRKKAKLKRSINNCLYNLSRWIPQGKKKLTWVYEIALIVGQLITIGVAIFVLTEPILIIMQIFLLLMTARQLFLSAQGPIKETKEQIKNIIEEWK